MSDNYPGKKIGDKIDELIAVAREIGAGKNYDSLDNKPAIDGHELNKNSSSASLGLETIAGSESKKAALEEAVAAEAAAREAYDHQQDAKLQTMTGHYYPLDGYDFGKTLDVKTPNPDDALLLATYAMTMEGVSDPEDIIENTVIKNEFDGVEFVWNAVTKTWLDWGVGNIVTAGNDHLGVVEGTADPGDGSLDGMVTVLLGGTMKTLGVAELKAQIGDIDAALDLINGESA